MAIFLGYILIIVVSFVLLFLPQYLFEFPQRIRKCVISPMNKSKLYEAPEWMQIIRRCEVNRYEKIDVHELYVPLSLSQCFLDVPRVCILNHLLGLIGTCSISFALFLLLSVFDFFEVLLYTQIYGYGWRKWWNGLSACAYDAKVPFAFQRFSSCAQNIPPPPALVTESTATVLSMVSFLVVVFVAVSVLRFGWFVYHKLFWMTEHRDDAKASPLIARFSFPISIAVAFVPSDTFFWAPLDGVLLASILITGIGFAILGIFRYLQWVVSFPLIFWVVASLWTYTQWTPLGYAIVRGNMEAIRVFYKNGAPLVGPRSEFSLLGTSYSPLSYPFDKGQTELVKAVEQKQIRRRDRSRSPRRRN
jgi:hypothetical protein